ncbi:MAG: porin family protein [Bacteroidales bacterium]|nr:porin family protein [Bacteroidales bacterium]MDZ4203410.1 porin family protein [Bacteroidales bacterium]
MKTRLISIVLILLLSATFASAQISFGILGGVNFQNLNGKDYNGDKLENDMIIGYHAGVNVQIPIASEFYFQPGLLFTTKGADNTNGTLTYKIRLSYVELPLNFVYKGALGNGYLLVGFGPYVGYGIGGKVTTEGGAASVERDVEFKSVVEAGDPLTVAYFKAFDAGGNIFAGYEMAGGIFFHLNTQLGMLAINPEYKILTNDKSSIKNTGFGLSLGYRF